MNGFKERLESRRFLIEMSRTFFCVLMNRRHNLWLFLMREYECEELNDCLSVIKSCISCMFLVCLRKALRAHKSNVIYLTKLYSDGIFI